MLITPLAELKSLAVNVDAPLVVPSATASAIVNVLFALKSPPPLNGLVVDIVLVDDNLLLNVVQSVELNAPLLVADAVGKLNV